MKTIIIWRCLCSKKLWINIYVYLPVHEDITAGDELAIAEVTSSQEMRCLGVVGGITPVNLGSNGG